jgi:DNA-directed RNA polymerase specialized sigma24 family protein
VLIDEVRRGRRLVPLPESLADPIGPQDEHLAVADTLARLPDAQRRLLALVYVDGYSLAEVAALTGTSEGAAKTALWRARSAFRRVYSEEIVAPDPNPAGARR